MDEQEQKVEATTGTIKKDRSPSFPFITLTKAVERARELYTAARRHEMRLPDAARAMNYGGKSSGAVQSLAALIAYGLLEDSGTGEARKFRISDLGFKLLEDQRPGAREAALAEAAMSPKLIADYFAHWGLGRPADGICTSELRIEGGFTEDGAKAFLRVFDDAVGYAKVGDSGKKSDTDGETGGDGKPSNQPPAVGDLVRVESGGQIIHERVMVRGLTERNGQIWVFVDGTETGQKMEEVTVIGKATPAPLVPPVLPFTPANDSVVEAGEEMDRFTVDEGVVKIAFPSGMTTDSVDELEQFFQLFIKKAKRRASKTYDL